MPQRCFPPSCTALEEGGDPAGGWNACDALAALLAVCDEALLEAEPRHCTVELQAGRGRGGGWHVLGLADMEMWHRLDADACSPPGPAAAPFCVPVARPSFCPPRHTGREHARHERAAAAPCCAAPKHPACARGVHAAVPAGHGGSHRLIRGSASKPTCRSLQRWVAVLLSGKLCLCVV